MNNKCLFNQEKISAYLDGELAGAERAEMEQHLKECAGCAGLFRELRQADEIFAGCAGKEQAPEYWNQYTAGLKEKLARVELSPRSTMVRWFGLAHHKWFGLAAAGILIVFASYFAARIVFPPSGLDEGGTGSVEPKDSIEDKTSAPITAVEPPPPIYKEGKDGPVVSKIYGKSGDGLTNMKKSRDEPRYRYFKRADDSELILTGFAVPVDADKILAGSEAVLLNYLNLDENNQDEINNFLWVMNDSGLVEKIRYNKNTVSDEALQKHFKRLEIVLLSAQNGPAPGDIAVLKNAIIENGLLEENSNHRLARMLNTD